jgi:hypothetical protein
MFVLESIRKKNLKRRVRAAHGREAQPNVTSYSLHIMQQTTFLLDLSLNIFAVKVLNIPP